MSNNFFLSTQYIYMCHGSSLEVTNILTCLTFFLPDVGMIEVEINSSYQHMLLIDFSFPYTKLSKAALVSCLHDRQTYERIC